MADAFRVLVTGPRLWPDPGLLRPHLLAAGREALGRGLQPVLVHGQCDPYQPAASRPRPIGWRLAKLLSWNVQSRLLGADWLADWIATDQDMRAEVPWHIERHPAEWDAPCRGTCRPGCRRRRRDGTGYCSAAGGYRNTKMVTLGADRCLAAAMLCTDPRHRSRPPHNTHGATDCKDKAWQAGIPVTPVELASGTLF